MAIERAKASLGYIVIRLQACNCPASFLLSCHMSLYCPETGEEQAG